MRLPHKVFKRSIVLTGLTISNSFLGFFVQLLMARKFGASEDLDYYFYSLSYPVFISATIVSVYGYFLTPKIASSDSMRREKIISSMFWFSLILVLFFVLLSPFFVFLQSNSLNISSEKGDLYYLFYASVFIGIVQTLQGLILSILNAIGRQVRAILLLSLPYVGMAVLVQLFYDMGVVSVALGMLIGIVLSLFFGFFWIRSYLRLELDLCLVFSFYKSGILVAIALTCFSSFSIIDSYWATKSGNGVLTIMSYSQRLLIALGNLVVAAISVLIVPKFSRALKEKDMVFLKHDFLKIIILFFTFNCFVWICYFVISTPFIQILFVGGEFGIQQANILEKVTKMMLPGVFFMLSSVIFFRLLYCFDAFERIGAIVGLLWSILYFLLSSQLYDYGPEGLAVSYSISWFIVFLVLLFIFFGKYKVIVNND
mgnify:CR=1 FL=1|tara:strand:- start:4238 stop:5518 length:1281 start_codon:yes stop_codon:yes gene_type:complete